MNYKLQKKLLHFETQGNVFEDFIASRKKKTAFFRKIIRICFYVHCGAVIVNILLAVLFKSGFATIPISVCVLGAAWLAFLAVANVKVMKTLLLIADPVFAAAGYTAGVFFAPRALYFICASVMVICTLAAVAAFTASNFREYLESFSPLSIRREDYRLLKSEVETPFEEEIPEEPLQPLPPLTSEMRELANQLKIILCGTDEDR